MKKILIKMSLASYKLFNSSLAPFWSTVLPKTINEKWSQSLTWDLVWIKTSKPKLEIKERKVLWIVDKLAVNFLNSYSKQSLFGKYVFLVYLSD